LFEPGKEKRRREWGERGRERGEGPHFSSFQNGPDKVL